MSMQVWREGITIGDTLKYGYESKNQSCTLTALLHLIEQKKLNLDKNLVLQFDTFEFEKDMTSPTIRTKREIST